MNPLVSRPQMRPVSLGLALMFMLSVLTGCELTSRPRGSTAVAVDDTSKTQSKSSVSDVQEDVLALAPLRHSGYVMREGLMMGPGLPGWDQVSGIAGKGPWAPPVLVDGRQGSWLEGIGGTLRFPVGQEGPSLRRIVIRLKSLPHPNAVSVFLDEKPLQTITLKPGWAPYEVELPPEGLSPGEHRLRFWFRQSGYRGRKRYCAAFGTVSLLKGAGTEPLSPSTFELGSADDNRLWAGAPSAWTFFVVPPTGATFKTQIRVTGGPPTDFVVKGQRDGHGEKVLLRGEVTRAQPVDIEIPFGELAGHPVRLTLETLGSWRSPDLAQWLNPRLVVTRLAPSATEFAAKNIIILAVDGLRSDRVGLRREGGFAPMPNLDRLARSGARIFESWVGSARYQDGHRQLLRPATDALTLPNQLKQLGWRTRIWSGSSELIATFGPEFQSATFLDTADDVSAMRGLLGELDRWISTGRDQAFFGYINMQQPSKPSAVALSLWRTDRDGKPQHDVGGLPGEDRALGAMDYWLGQLLALLERRGELADTLLVVTGTAGRWTTSAAPSTEPAALHVPSLFWTKTLAQRGLNPTLTNGHIREAPAIILSLVDATMPANWPGQGAIYRLLGSQEGLLKPETGFFAGALSVRFGDYTLTDVSTSGARLFRRLAPDSGWSPLEGSYPITFRTLRQVKSARP